MFRDKSLIPTEAIRLAALGLLIEKPQHYGELAAEIQHFTSCVAGPSVDLMGTSLELLRLEGLVAPVDGAGMADNSLMRITPAGIAALQALLQAQLRAPLGDYNRFVMLLKLRFLRHLPEREQNGQLERIGESIAAELTRLEDLRRHHEAAGADPFLDWLGLDIAALKARLDWLTAREQAPRPGAAPQ